MKALALYSLVCLAAILATGLLLAQLFHEPAARHALFVSGLVALLVQLPAFALLARFRGPEVMAGWTIGVIARFVVLALYALVVVKALGLELDPALIGLATFFVICTLLEPLLLRYQKE